MGGVATLTLPVCTPCGSLQSSARYSVLFNTDDLYHRMYHGLLCVGAAFFGLHCRHQLRGNVTTDDALMAAAVAAVLALVAFSFLRAAAQLPKSPARGLCIAEGAASALCAALFALAAGRPSPPTLLGAVVVCALCQFVVLPLFELWRDFPTLAVEHYSERLGTLVLAVVANCVREMIAVDPSTLVRCCSCCGWCWSAAAAVGCVDVDDHQGS